MGGAAERGQGEYIIQIEWQNEYCCLFIIYTADLNKLFNQSQL